MHFLHFWPIYLGAGAAALPVLVHWLTRPRPRKASLSTLRFVREVLQQRKARSRLRDIIILALRTAAILLLAAAVARPLWRGQTAIDRDGEGQVARVVLLDASQSMAAGRNGIQNFERARARAAEQLAYRPGLRANLILAAAAPKPVFEHLSTNLAALHDALDGGRVAPQRLNVAAAIAKAGDMLAAVGAAGPELRRELVIVSDFQRANWAAADFASLPADTRIRLESVAPAETPGNMAIVRAGVQGPTSLGKQARLEVEVANYSPGARPVRCEVTIGDATYHLEGAAAAGAKTVLAQEVPLGVEGWQAGEARLLDALDALAADDARGFVVEVRPAPLVALVTRQPADASASSSFYLERALSPYADARHGETPRVARIEPEQLDGDAALAAQLIVIDHPGKLPIEGARLLANLLRRGRALWYVAAEPIDAINLKQLAELSGAGWQAPVEFVLPESGRARQNLFLTDLKRDQAPFSLWGDAVIGAMGSLRFGGGLDSRRLATGLGDDLVANFSDGSAALVVCASGAGWLAVLNADLAKSNLPASPLFVPLVAELSDRLLGDRRRGAAVLSGEPLAVYLSPEAGRAAGLRILAPSSNIVAPSSNASAANDSTDSQAKSGAPAPGDDPVGELIDEGGGLLWRAGAAPGPGVYRVARGDATMQAIAVETPSEESDLAPLSAELLEGRLAGGRHVQYRDARADDDTRDDLWTWLATAAVVGLLAEFAMLRAYRT